MSESRLVKRLKIDLAGRWQDPRVQRGMNPADHRHQMRNKLNLHRAPGNRS